MKSVFRFSTFVWNISHSKKNWARREHKGTLVFVYSTRYSCLILIKLEFSGQIFEKYSNIKFHKNPSGESRVVLCGQTERWADRPNKDSGHFSQK